MNIDPEAARVLAGDAEVADAYSQMNRKERRAMARAVQKEVVKKRLEVRARQHNHKQHQEEHMGELDFGEAIRAAKEGKRLQRRGWNGKGMYIELQRPDAHSKMTEPYLYMKTAQGTLIPWLASQADVLAVDWSVVEG